MINMGNTARDEGEAPYIVDDGIEIFDFVTVWLEEHQSPLKTIPLYNLRYLIFNQFFTEI